MANGSDRGNTMSEEARNSFGVINQRLQTAEGSIQEVRNQFATLNSKMDDQARVQQDKIDTLFRSLDQRLSGQIDSVARELGKQVESVNEKVNVGRIPNYAVVLGFLGVAITVFGTVYTFVSTPINKSIAELQSMNQAERLERNAMLAEIRTNMVPRTELSERWRIVERDADAARSQIAAIAAASVSREELATRSERAAEDRARTVEDIRVLREQMSALVTRAEWGERNQSRDHDIENIEQTLARMETNLQRQIDTQKHDFTAFAGSLGNGRDTFQDMKQELNRLEERLDTYRMQMSRNYRPMNGPTQ